MAWNVVIAGGGTGGHLYPGIAVARELLRRHPDARITFAGTARGIEARPIEPDGEVSVHAVGLHKVALNGLEEGDTGVAVAEDDRVAAAVPDVGVPPLHAEDIRVPGDRAPHVGHHERDVVEPLGPEARHADRTCAMSQVY